MMHHGGTIRVKEKVILVVGSCGLDRLLTVSSYPEADSKVRSTAYNEVGGGNASNTASAMALLANATVFRNERFRIKLLTKVGHDYIGQQLKDELCECGVDTSLVCRGGKASTTSVTTVIVSEEEHTRTCIHTPGTSGDFSIHDLESVDLVDLFTNVVHVHSDSRLAEVSLVLAKEAKKLNIPISIDAEKDRHVVAFDDLLDMSSILFTNSAQLQDYLIRRTAKLEKEQNRRPLPDPVITIASDDEFGIEGTCALGIAPSHFFRRWFNQNEKEVVITKGHMGALHVCCDSSSVTKGVVDRPRVHEVVAWKESVNNTAIVKQTVSESNEQEGWTVEQSYKVDYAGVLMDATVVDTTGAGDAFIAGYLLIQHLSQPSNNSPIQLGLEFGAWVSGKKLGGAGARSALPTGNKVLDDELGRTIDEVQARLQVILRPFMVDST